MKHLLRSVIKQYLTETMKNLVSVDLVLKAKLDNEQYEIQVGEKFVIDNVGTDTVTLHRIADTTTTELGSYKPSSLIVTYDDLEKLFDLG